MKNKRTYLPILFLILFSILFGLILYKNIRNSYKIQKKDLEQVSQSIISIEFFKTQFNTSDLSQLSQELKSSSELTPDLIKGPVLDKIKVIFKNYLTCITESKNKLSRIKISARFGITTSLFIVYQNSKPQVLIGETTQIPELSLFGDMEKPELKFLRTYFHHRDRDMNYYFRINFYVRITNQNILVFHRLKGLIFFSILGILIVLTFSIYISRAFLSQKKISEMKDDFIDNITHELNTPLTTIDVALETMGRMEPGDDRTPLTDTIKRQNLRLKGMINKIMQISFFEKEGIYLNLSKRSVNQLLENICKDFLVKYQNNLNLKFQFNSSRDVLLIDPFHFETVIVNLLENSVKYGDKIADTTLKTYNQNNDFYIIISDRGEGIPVRHHKHIFNKFYRLRNRVSKNKPGLGLGLYLVKKIITAHNGTIKLKNNPEGGCSFIIQLPINKR